MRSRSCEHHWCGRAEMSRATRRTKRLACLGEADDAGTVSEAEVRSSVQCRCLDVERFDGADADAYASGHLTLIERGRGDNEMYLCHDRGTSWIMDFPLGHWAADRRGMVRLRRKPIDHDALPVGALDL